MHRSVLAYNSRYRCRPAPPCRGNYTAASAIGKPIPSGREGCRSRTVTRTTGPATAAPPARKRSGAGGARGPRPAGAALRDTCVRCRAYVTRTATSGPILRSRRSGFHRCDRSSAPGYMVHFSNILVFRVCVHAVSLLDWVKLFFRAARGQRGTARLAQPAGFGDTVWL
jgi:hypothetical protein